MFVQDRMGRRKKSSYLCWFVKDNYLMPRYKFLNLSFSLRERCLGPYFSKEQVEGQSRNCRRRSDIYHGRHDYSERVWIYGSIFESSIDEVIHVHVSGYVGRNLCLISVCCIAPAPAVGKDKKPFPSSRNLVLHCLFLLLQSPKSYSPSRLQTYLQPRGIDWQIVGLLQRSTSRFLGTTKTGFLVLKQFY